MSWASPYIWENEFRTEIVTTGQNRIRSYDLNGKLIWEMDGRMSWACIATPFASHGMVYVSSGYFQDRHRPVYAIRPGASGDITMDEDQTSSEFVAWYQPEAGNYNTSPLVYRDLYYSVLDRGSFECYDALTGEQVYSQRRIAEKGRASFTSSPWAYNGKIFCLSEQGETYVVEAGPAFKLLHQNSLGEMCMSSPAIARVRPIIRPTSTPYSIRHQDLPPCRFPPPRRTRPRTPGGGGDRAGRCQPAQPGVFAWRRAQAMVAPAVARWLARIG